MHKFGEKTFKKIVEDYRIKLLEKYKNMVDCGVLTEQEAKEQFQDEFEDILEDMCITKRIVES